MRPLDLHYQVDGVELKALSRHLAELSEELNRPGRLRSELEAVGLNPSDVPSFSQFATIKPIGHGLDLGTAGVVVTLALPFMHAGAKVTQQVMIDVWRKILLPRVERRFGRGVMKEVEDQKVLPKKPSNRSKATTRALKTSATSKSLKKPSKAESLKQREILKVPAASNPKKGTKASRKPSA